MYPTEFVPAAGGPAWLQDVRTQASQRVTDTGLPTFEMEEWRYSPIEDLNLGAYQPVTVPSAVAEIAIPDGFSGVVNTIDGVVQSLALDPAVAAKGVTLSLANEAAEAVAFGAATDVFAEANLAFGQTPVLLRVPGGVDVEHPIAVHHECQADRAASFPRLRIEVGPDAGVTVLETLTSGDIAAMTSPVTEIIVGQAARVRYQHVQELGPRVWQIGSLVAEVESQANFIGGMAAMGGHYARMRSDCRLVGRGANGDLLALYFGNGEQTLDFRTFQDHVAPDTTSRLLFKGVLDDESKSVYTGLIKVAPEAAGTNAYQTNRNIKLSDAAWAESVPNLEIENNDVRCSHASTVGPVDAEQRFYLESRGIPTSVVERLIVTGFFDEVLRELPVPAVTDRLRADVQDKLDGRIQ